jgi:hypothetical protein
MPRTIIDAITADGRSIPRLTSKRLIDATVAPIPPGIKEIAPASKLNTVENEVYLNIIMHQEI